jgi:hypothetical protein
MNPGSIRGLASLPPHVVRIGAFLLALYAVLSLNARAFNSSLQPEEVQDAYSLGQTTNHEELADFLKQYQHDFQYPADHPVAFVQSVEFQTPYEQIVLRTLRTAGYTKFQAGDDYRTNAGLVLVRVVVALRINYGGPLPPADSFQVVVSQAKPIEPQRMTGTVLCDPYSQITYPYYVNRDCSIYAREILLRFEPGQFAPGRATVKVVLPYDRSLETKYSLDKLR